MLSGKKNFPWRILILDSKSLPTFFYTVNYLTKTGKIPKKNSGNPKHT
jgi:hypothetical protein